MNTLSWISLSAVLTLSSCCFTHDDCYSYPPLSRNKLAGHRKTLENISQHGVRLQVKEQLYGATLGKKTMQYTVKRTAAWDTLLTRWQNVPKWYGKIVSCDDMYFAPPARSTQIIFVDAKGNQLLRLHDGHIGGYYYQTEDQKKRSMYQDSYKLLPHFPRLRPVIEAKSKAAQGDAAAQYKLSQEYFLDNYSSSEEHNLEKGLYWLRRAAKQNYYEALRDLGDAYAEGMWGLAKDPQRAAHYYSEAQKHARHNYQHENAAENLKKAQAQIHATQSIHP